MDEIILARVLEKKQTVYPEYVDEEGGETAEDYLHDDETEYDNTKGTPLIV